MVVASMLLLAASIGWGAALGRGEGTSPQTADPDDATVLDEVTVGAGEPSYSLADAVTWLRRLPGDYKLEGYLESTAQETTGSRVNALGEAQCIGFGIVPGVYCDLRLKWTGPDQDSATIIPSELRELDPATILFGIEGFRREIGETKIRHHLVDNRGIAIPALGVLVGNTLNSREKCLGALENCQRVTKITTNDDLKEVHVSMDFEVAYQRTLSVRIVMHRLPAQVAD